MSHHMRCSRVLARLRAGKPVSCFKLNLADGRIAEIAAQAGFDCLWLDMEHVPNDLSVVETAVWAAKGQDVDVMVRVSRGGYSDYIRPLEANAAGIMVPHLMSLADAKAIVRMTRFHPLGRRPLDGGNADGAYCGIESEDYIREANAQRFVIVQIEDPEPLAELEAIASLPGIDMLFFGPADFSQGIGAPCQWDHPVLLETRKRVAQVALAHGKFAGTVASPTTMDSLLDMGYRFLNMGSDVRGLVSHCQSLVAEFNKRS